MWENQQPLITSSRDDLRPWPGHLERTQEYGTQSACALPLTAASAGLLVILVIVAGLPSVGLLRSTVALTSLADLLRGGVGVVSQFTS